MAEFKVGDRVVATENHDMAALTGSYGTIVTVDDGASAPYGVEFDVDFFGVNNLTRQRGHNLYGTVANYRGWWMPADKLALADSPAKPDWDWEVVGEELNDLINLAERESKRVSEPPKLDATNLLKCIIASKSYPYATLDTTGVLYFYSDLPKGIVVFETTAVKM